VIEINGMKACDMRSSTLASSSSSTGPVCLARMRSNSSRRNVHSIHTQRGEGSELSPPAHSTWVVSANRRGEGYYGNKGTTDATDTLDVRVPEYCG
jgi:hypothetical protein